MSGPDARGLLTPEEYRLLAAPAIRAAAELAAQRGDPDLYNDMASMLALLAMVSALVQAYGTCREEFTTVSPPEALEAAPGAVCMLVFTRSELEPSLVADCLQALSAAYLLLLRQGVIGPQEAYVQKAFRALCQGEREVAHRLLLQAARAITWAVDEWETRRQDLGMGASRT
ncbi:MAG: hypothetical protein KGJ08_09960 [Gammaproteobacteria bacterium]|nr:hypothetical protein [Gammaproteobacteria bacterium]